MTLIALLPRLWREAMMAALFALAAALWLGKAAAERKAARLRQELGAATALIERERAEVRAAAMLARANDAAHAARIERDQSRISEEVSNDYQNQLGALRARHRALGLHAGPPADTAGGGGRAGVPGLSGAAGCADGAAGEDRLPAEDALTASEQAVRLKALQEWVREVGEAAR